jgi:N-acetylmuramoyl-L-alanine amidase
VVSSHETLDGVADGLVEEELGIFHWASLVPVVAEVATAAALICLDPGHNTLAAVGRQTEPIGPHSPIRKIKDGGGAPGEAAVALTIAVKARSLLRAAGYRVALTRGTRPYAGGNIARARFCNVRRAALMIRVHADGSSNASLHGVQTLYPAFHRGWTDDIYVQSLRAARVVHAAVVRATGAADLGLTPRADLTGFNWADVPAILVETGFMTNPVERRRLESPSYQLRVARGLVAGTQAFVRP